jgi:menaquinone-specific isochorismate synthase
MPASFAFIQTAPGRLFVGWGPFERLAFRRPERPGFFITDFFLDEKLPWRHPARGEEMGVEEFAARFEKGASARLAWQRRDDSFASLFHSAKEAMRRGDFQKIVPVTFDDGRIESGSIGDFLVRRLPSLPPTMRAYGFVDGEEGFIGATPEILFRSDARGYETMALAGTRDRSEARALLEDEKEMREHRIVIDDIVRRLSPFGNVAIDETEILALPALAHLSTMIHFEERGPEKLSFSEMIRRLHPTAALGASPRTDAAERWLREADGNVDRGIFGAPFGLEREDHTSLALVAIRNVQWVGDHVRIGAGCGLLAESRLDRESAELRQKREQVRALFGLAASVTVEA